MKTLEGFTNFVPNGAVTFEDTIISVQDFYMSSSEISNLQYAEFLNDLKVRGELDKLKIAMYDSSLWNASPTGELNKYKDFYHSHPAFQNYPIVNITREGAELFCEWLSAEYDSLSNGELKLTFRLPTRAEWIRAAKGDVDRKVYSWDSALITNEDGQLMANCIRNGAECITRNKETGRFEVARVGYEAYYDFTGTAHVTAPIRSYWPNQYGLYNMNGNVAEMVSDGNIAVGGDWRSPGYDIRNESVQDFNSASQTVGFRVVATIVK